MKTKKKTCSKCKVEKPIIKFGNLKSSKDGLMGLCVDCNRNRNREYLSKKKKKTEKVVQKKGSGKNNIKIIENPTSKTP